jgi:RNA polymerase sigma-70 factor (ECF subfamily)
MNSSWDEIVAAAADAWPTIVLSRERFIAYLTERLPDDAGRDEALRSLHTSDLYLACACADGDAHALQAFETHCLSVVGQSLARLHLDQDMCAEVKQRLRHALFVHERGRARIEGFQGKGTLRAWIRVMAVRDGLAILRRLRFRTAIHDDQLMDTVAAADTPDVAYLKRKYRNEFRLAFADAVRSLTDRERLFLRQRFLDGLAVIEIARLHRMDRGTAARWIERARASVLEATRASLADRFAVPPEEIDSILRLVGSQLEVSLRVLLRRRTE